MRLLGSYFHVYVFAAFSIGFAVAVANDPVAFERKLQPVARDAGCDDRGCGGLRAQLPPWGDGG